MNRRQFLARTLPALALTLAAPRLHAGESPLSLGFSLYGMKSLPLLDALQVCADIGYRNVELAMNEGFSADPKLLSPPAREKLRAELARLKLSVSAGMLNLSLAVDDATHARNLEALQAAASLSRELAPDHPPLLETVAGGKPDQWEAQREQMAERLRSWVATAAAEGVVVAIKAHVGSAVNSPERLLWLLEQAKGTVADFDYSHFQLAGLTLEASLRPLLPFTKFIHVKDAEGDAKKFRFLLPGEGTTDYLSYFKVLQELGYRGPVVVEVSAQIFNQPGYNPGSAAHRSYEHLHQALVVSGMAE